jgi:hypothetical protein
LGRGDRIIWQSEAGTDAERLSAGVACAIIPLTDGGPEPQELIVEICSAENLVVCKDSLRIPTWSGVLSQAVQIQPTTPFAMLRREQLARLALRGPRLSDVALAQQWIEDLKQGRTQSGVDRVLIAGSDGSRQPWRLSIPKNPRLVALVLASSDPCTKDLWPTLPKTWIQSAIENEITIVEVYPSGDPWWGLVGLERAWQTLQCAKAEFPALSNLPVIAIGLGRGAAGVLGLAARRAEAFRFLVFAGGTLDTWNPLWISGVPATLQGLASCDAPQLQGSVLATDDPMDAAMRQVFSRLPPKSIRLPKILDASFWPTMNTLVANTPPNVDSWRVDGPGRYGSIRVGGLIDRTRCGRITLGAQSITCENLAALSSDLALSFKLPSGEPWKPTAKDITGGPLANCLARPFTIVIGGTHSETAIDANRKLARDFLRVWAERNEGDPQFFSDEDVLDALPKDRDLICIGNTASNRLLARWSKSLPISWTEREVTMWGRKLERSGIRGLAVAVARPDDPQHSLIILEGEPLWSPQGHIFSGLGDWGLKTSDGRVQTGMNP